jgi:polyhydroxyalkanoate synthesis regulator phasin
MDQQQQQQINQAAEQFASAVRDSYQAVADRTVSAQELNAELTQQFFNSVINSLQQQAEGNRQLTQQLADQQQRQQEATQALTQESVGAYMDFINSMFSYYQGSVEQAQRGAQQEAPPR